MKYQYNTDNFRTNLLASSDDNKKTVYKRLIKGALFLRENYKLKYGDTARTYVRSGRPKTLSDSSREFPYMTNTYNSATGDYGFPTTYVKKGMDYELIQEYAEIGPSRHFTILFNAFLWMTIFNFISARKLKDELNIFKGITKNMLFLIIVAAIIILQILIVSVGGTTMNCYYQMPTPGLTA